MHCYKTSTQIAVFERNFGKWGFSCFLTYCLKRCTSEGFVYDMSVWSKLGNKNLTSTKIDDVPEIDYNSL